MRARGNLAWLLALFMLLQLFPVPVLGQAGEVREGAFGQPCTADYYREGINVTKSTFRVEEAESGSVPNKIYLFMTTNRGRTCRDILRPKNDNIPRSEFENPSSLGSGTRFTSFQSGIMPKYFVLHGRRVTGQRIEKNFEVSIIVDTDPNSSTYAYTRGVYLRNESNDVLPWLGWGGFHEVINGPYMDWPTFKSRYDENNMANDISREHFRTFKPILDGLHSMTGRLVKGLTLGEETTNNVKLEGNLDIDFTGSELEAANVRDDVGPFKGLRDRLPNLGDGELKIALWFRNPDYFLGYSLKETISIPLRAGEKSTGKFSLNKKLLTGEYFATGAVDIKTDATVQAAGENLLVEPIGKPIDLSQYERQLSEVEASLTNDNVSQYYVGITGEGRTAVFFGLDKFTVEKETTQITTNPVMKLLSETPSDGSLTVGNDECGIFSIIAAGDIGEIFSKMIDCMFKRVFRPMIDWAADLVQKAAGVSWGPEPAIHRKQLLA